VLKYFIGGAFAIVPCGIGPGAARSRFRRIRKSSCSRALRVERHSPRDLTPPRSARSASLASRMSHRGEESQFEIRATGKTSLASRYIVEISARRDVWYSMSFALADAIVSSSDAIRPTSFPEITL
jgi:hypothetical protein